MRRLVYRLLIGFSLFAMMGCAYSISHTPYKNSLPVAENDLSVLLVISRESSSHVEIERGLDGSSWTMEIGKALLDLAPRLFRSQYGSVTVTDTTPSKFKATSKNHLVILDILSFKPDIGLTVFSEHDGVMRLSVEARGRKNQKKVVSGSGSDSGSHYLQVYGGLILPGIGITGYNEAMSVMITNTVTSAVAKALEVVQECR